jgi:hypothetical protein
MAQVSVATDLATVFNASDANANSGEYVAAPKGRTYLIFSVVGATWTGTIKAEGQVTPTGSFTSVANVALVNLTSGATVAGGTGAAADGLFSCEITGMRVRLAHARSAGSVTVVARVVHVE